MQPLANSLQENPAMEFSLIIPTLNERDNILVLLELVRKNLEGCSHEVIVVDDDSSDKTWELVEQYAQSHPGIKVIRRLNRTGLSAAVLEGFEHAHGQFLGVMDADLSHDPALLSPLVEAMRSGCEMAVASRRIAGGGADQWPWFRRLYSGVATFLAKLWLGASISDPMSGYFAIRREVLNSCQPNPRGYKIMLELATRAQIKSIKEIPLIFKDRKQGYSKLTSSVALQYLFMLWDLRSYAVPVAWLRKTYHTARYKKVMRFLMEGKILDIGCGRPCETMPDQAFLRFLNREGGVGLDVKPMQGPFEFHQGSIEKIPFADNSFDNVVAMEILEHIDQVPIALKEIKRVLKPGGVFVMSTPDWNWLWESFWYFWTRFIGRMWDHTHLVSFRLPQWLEFICSEFDVKGWKRHWGFDLIICGSKSDKCPPIQT